MARFKIKLPNIPRPDIARLKMRLQNLPVPAVWHNLPPHHKKYTLWGACGVLALVLVLGGVSLLGGSDHPTPKVARVSTKTVKVILAKPGAEKPMPTVRLEEERSALEPTAPAPQPETVVLAPPPPLTPEAPTPLTPAPIADIEEITPDGPLPKVTDDGKSAFKLYSRPTPDVAPNTPRLVIIVTGLGLAPKTTLDISAVLPGAITLAFSPYAPNLADQVTAVRAEGHEVLLDIPMEPLNYPAEDPGPLTLLTQAGPGDNITRLNRSLSKASGYVGIMSSTGTAFLKSKESLAPIFAYIARRGLSWLDATFTSQPFLPSDVGVPTLPTAAAAVRIDDVLTLPAIDGTLNALAAQARQNGFAIGIARPYPLTISRLRAFQNELDRLGVVLVPASATLEGR